MNKPYLSILFLIFLSCRGKGNFKGPADYDLSKPERFIMPETLDEISGINFYEGNSDTIYAEQDEQGKLYHLHLGDKKASYARFGKAGDYEDIAIINEMVVLLRSDGTLFSFPFNERNRKEIADVKEWDSLLPNGEFEGLCADAKTNQLYVLCKHCSVDEATEAITAYILQLQPGGSITQNGSASISVKTIAKLANEPASKFRPSGFAKSPKTDQWYILSAVNKMLVIADKDWNVKEVYRLDPSIFRQPEGIAFDNKNNLYISNEGDELSAGNVLKFIFKKNN